MSTETIPSFSDCYIGWDEGEPTHQIFDSRHVKRATAIGIVVGEYGIDFKDARCRVTHCRWRTRQERWDDGGGERWWDDQGHFEAGQWVPHDDEYPDGPPDTPPDDWQPEEGWAAFEECSRDAPGAVKCWKVETGL